MRKKQVGKPTEKGLVNWQGRRRRKGRGRALQMQGHMAGAGSAMSGRVFGFGVCSPSLLRGTAGRIQGSKTQWGNCRGSSQSPRPHPLMHKAGGAPVPELKGWIPGAAPVLDHVPGSRASGCFGQYGTSAIGCKTSRKHGNKVIFSPSTTHNVKPRTTTGRNVLPGKEQLPIVGYLRDVYSMLGTAWGAWSLMAGLSVICMSLSFLNGCHSPSLWAWGCQGPWVAESMVENPGK